MRAGSSHLLCCGGGLELEGSLVGWTELEGEREVGRLHTLSADPSRSIVIAEVPPCSKILSDAKWPAWLTRISGNNSVRLIRALEISGAAYVGGAELAYLGGAELATYRLLPVPPCNLRGSFRIAMQRVVDMEVDPDFNIHTSYHNDFFLLKTRVTVNGENTQIKSVKAGSNEEPTLVYGSTISAKLWLIANSISPILHKLGVYHMDTFYYEQSPLFHVVFSSEACLKKFLLEMGSFKFGMEQELLSIFSDSLETTRISKTESPQHLSVEVHPELLLVSPNLQKTKGADLHLITADNASIFAAQWINSKLFEFGPLCKEGGTWEKSLD